MTRATQSAVFPLRLFARLQPIQGEQHEFAIRRLALRWQPAGERIRHARSRTRACNEKNIGILSGTPTDLANYPAALIASAELKKNFFLGTDVTGIK